MSSIKIFTDGGARGNPGPAAAAFVALSQDNEIAEGSKYLGETTNNVAEYNAVIMALDWLCSKDDLDCDNVIFYIDSQLLVKQVNGEYKVKNKRLSNLHQIVLRRINNCNYPIELVHVKREKNKRADALVNIVLDENTR